jgi:orotate phosphoribosyltransferase
MLRAMGTKPYQDRFLSLLAENDVVRFGEFTLKSGRKSPYFINAGQLRTGRAIAGVGRAYAERIREAGLSPDVVFGPSYKGIPLAVATAIALSEGAGEAGRGRDVGFCFDRKEAKEHGEGGTFVGTQPAEGQAVVLVDDVITSGISIERTVELLRQAAAVRILGVVVAVDRQERGRERSTLAELESALGAPVLPVVNVRQIVERLYPEEKARIEEYLGLYGAS